jgi:hypothetical protein
MNENFKLNLQLFGGEGAGAGASGASGTGEGGGQATTGENATAAAEQRLRELGVPEAKIRKSASKVASRMPTQTAQTADVAPKEDANVESATTEEKPTTEDTKDNNVSTNRMSWDEIMKDPEYNKEMQAVVRSRLKSEKSAEEALGKMAPAIEVMARKYGLDAKNMDYEALAKAINDDDAYYEEKALEMGVSVETAKKVDQMERNTAREKALNERTLQEQKIQQHFVKLEQQGEALKKVFPNFDLRKELQNPVFARMTAPGVGLSVEDAYYAIHRNEIQTAAMQITAQKTAEKISNAIQSGSRRPDESGASSQAPSVSTFDYRNASREQREALKKRIRDAAARGEKLYPGQ